jgi:hypothetical protein
VFVQGDLVYVGQGPRVVILNVAEPASPEVLARTTPLPNYINDIEVVGNVLYATVQTSGFHIFDVADPSDPVEIGSFTSTGPSHAIAVVGNLAYFADGINGLRVIDVADPNHPILLGHVDAGIWANAVALQDNIAYVANDWGGLHIVDVTDPTQPVEIGALDTAGHTGDVAVEGPLAYLADGEDGLRIIDVSDPTQPNEIGGLDTPGHTWGLAVVEDTVCLADWWNGLRIVDVSTPTDPVELGVHDTPGWSIRVACSGNLAYVADGDGGLRIFDVSYQAVPSELAVYDSLGFTHEIALRDTVAYVAGAFSGLRVLDMTDPAHPKQLATFATGGTVVSVAVAGNTAFALDKYTGLHIVDVTDPASPVLLSTLAATSGLAVRADELTEIVVIAQGDQGMRILDVSDPANPVPLSTFDTRGSAQDIVLRNQIAYVANGWEGLLIVDISNPTAPATLANYPAHPASSIALSGQFAYVVSEWPGLPVINISNPTRPVWMGFAPTDPGSVGVAAANDTAYVIDSTATLHAFDVSDPTRPTPLVIQDVPGSGQAVTLANNVAYVAGGHGGLSLVGLLRDKQRAAIDPDGGLLASGHGETFLLFPSGVFTQPASVTYRHLLNDQDIDTLSVTPPLRPAGIGHTFDIDALITDTGQAAQLAPGQNYTVLIHYTDGERGATVEESLKLHTWDGSRWVPEATSIAYPAMNTVVAYPQHLGLFALLGQVHQIHLPIALGSEPPPFSLSFSVRPDRIRPGQGVTISWSVQGARKVYLDGDLVPNAGSRQAWPMSTTTYVLQAIKWDGSVHIQTVTVTVDGVIVTPTSTRTPAPTPTPLYAVRFNENRSIALIDGSRCQTGNGCAVFQIQVSNTGNRSAKYFFVKSPNQQPGWSSFFCWGNSCEFGTSPRPRTLETISLETAALNYLLPSFLVDGETDTVTVLGYYCEEDEPCPPDPLNPARQVYEQTFRVTIQIPTPMPTTTSTPTPTSTSTSTPAAVSPG